MRSSRFLNLPRQHQLCLSGHSWPCGNNAFLVVHSTLCLRLFLQCIDLRARGLDSDFFNFAVSINTFWEVLWSLQCTFAFLFAMTLVVCWCTSVMFWWAFVWSCHILCGLNTFDITKNAVLVHTISLQTLFCVRRCIEDGVFATPTRERSHTQHGHFQEFVLTSSM